MSDADPPWTVEKRDSQTLRTGPDRWFGRPSLAARPDGTWVMVFREAPRHAPSTDSAFHVAFSADEGETWTDDDTSLDGDAVEGFPHTHARSDGGVQLGSVLHHRGDLLVHVTETREPFEGWEGTRQLRSTDGGLTWTDEGIIDPDGVAPELFLLGQDEAVDPETGDLYAGVNYRHPESNLPETPNAKSGVVHTSDGGHSWEYVADVTGFEDHTGEIGLTFVGDELVALLRNTDDSDTYIRRSPDRGETWGELRAVGSLGILQKARLYAPADVGGDAHHGEWLYAVGRHVLDFDLDLDRGEERRHVRGSQHTAIAASPDAGETWHAPVHLDEFAWPAPFGDCGYCDLLARRDGGLYVATYGGPAFDRATDLLGYALREETHSRSAE
jgi:hypothetical protein